MLIKIITFYLDLFVHHHLEIRPVECAHTDLSVSPTSEVHPGSVSLLGCFVPSAFSLEFPQLYQIVTLST
jgi:hypothetical protein